MLLSAQRAAGSGVDETGEEPAGAAHRADLETLQRGQPAGGVRDHPAPESGGAHRRHRKVDGRRRHLPLHAQLQRRPADLFGLHQQRRLPPQKDLGETLQNGPL